MLAKNIPPPEFRAPRSGVPIDLDAHIKALPAKAAAKGMFFSDLIKLAEGKLSPEEIATRAGVPHRRYVPFMDYPMADLHKITVEVAKVVHPKLPLGDALRLLGRRSYVIFLGSHAGRVLIMSLGQDIEKVMLMGPKAYRIALNFGQFWVERVGERHIRFGVEEYPGFLETQQVGVVEGVFEHFGVRGQVQLALTDIGSGVFDIYWQPKET